VYPSVARAIDSEISMLVLGSSAVDVIPYLIDRHQNIETIRLVQYKRHTRSADVCPECGSSLRPSTATRRLRHDTSDREWHTLRRGEATSPRLLRLIADLPQDGALAVTSRVTDGRQIRHLPMIDFQCPHADKKNIIEGMHQIHPAGGILLQTTNSYHFYGNALLTHSDWVRFIGSCLLLEPYVDVRWHGHRLIEGWGSLRISRDPTAGTTLNEPSVVAILEPKSP
jgi:hypothetical protein